MTKLRFCVACILIASMLVGCSSSTVGLIQAPDTGIEADHSVKNPADLGSDDEAETMTFPSETDPFVADFLIGDTDQSAPFFDVILPAIKANIKENNNHSISPHYDEFPLANNPENF